MTTQVRGETTMTRLEVSYEQANRLYKFDSRDHSNALLNLTYETRDALAQAINFIDELKDGIAGGRVILNDEDDEPTVQVKLDVGVLELDVAVQLSQMVKEQDVPLRHESDDGRYDTAYVTLLD